jgi:hypothetical protein
MEYQPRTPADDEIETLDATTPADDDRIDDGILAADDTGMIASERLITNAEIIEGDPDLAGNV